MVRPEPIFANKPVETFRDYDGNSEIHERVRRTYKLMHTHQTMDFAQGKVHMNLFLMLRILIKNCPLLFQLNEWCRFDRFSATIMEALERLNNLIDESDPDTNLPNIVHAFQTAERIREAHPDRDWFHLTGLIHDLGKV